jgi:hypothetical protein
VLLSAFLDEFSAEKDREKVVLFLRARMDEKARKEYSEFIEKYIKDNEKKKEELPSIVLLEDLAPYTKLPALFAFRFVCIHCLPRVLTIPFLLS